MRLADIRVREGRDDDERGLIRLICACFADYPGCVLAVDEEMPQLRRIATDYAARDGRVWVAEHAGEVVGSVATQPYGGAALELRMLYVAHAARRLGLAAALCAGVEAEARARGAGAVDLWSDTRFEDAHRLYGRLGYRRSGAARALHDLSSTVEYHFRKSLRA